METTISGLVIMWTRTIFKFSALSLAFQIRELNNMKNGRKQSKLLKNVFSIPQNSFTVIDNQYANYKIVTTTKGKLSTGRLTLKKTSHIYSILMVVAVMQLYTSAKTHQTIHLKQINFMVYNLYLNKIGGGEVSHVTRNFCSKYGHFHTQWYEYRLV